ncbi:hypothetical protein VNO78_26449 [Psophocarpus tetragonolobus]|uniref:Probable purine permease n=1 Tax=Psophocarpus tetragonolobus TaxID=3891 RepID=A0AAN9X900_PSOTE
MSVTKQPQRWTLRNYKRWLRVSLYTTFLIGGQCTANILGRLYFEKGGESKWVAALLQSLGFPILIPLVLYFSKRTKLTDNDSSKTKPKPFLAFSCYLFMGLLSAAMDLMYAYGLAYLPLSTFALICATQLAFNAIFTFFLNSQKFTALILNSVVILTVSVSLLAISEEPDHKKNLPKEKRILGIFLTLAASATFSIHHCLEQLCFEKVIKTEIVPAVLKLNLYQMIVACSGSLVGFLVSGEWKTLNREMNEFENGKVAYIMTLVWTAVTWQIAFIGVSGLTFEVSPLFSVAIGSMELTIAPVLAVIVLHDKIHGVKVLAFLLAIWGLLSYMYQHYLDDSKAKELEVSNGEVEF